MLQKELGEEAFWKSIRQYTARHREQNVETGDFRRAIEEATGRNLSAFFRQWFHRGGHPELTVSFEWDGDASLVRMTIAQKQAEDALTPAVFELNVPIEFETRSAGA